MSILKRLKALFGGVSDDENKNISKEDVLEKEKLKEEKSSKSKEISSKDIKLEKDVVSGTKTSESVTDTNKVAEEKSLKAEEEKPSNADEKESSKEEPSKFEEKESSKEEPSKEEKVIENSNKKDKKRDKMTLLNDNEVYSMEDIDKDFTKVFIDAGIDTVEHCFQCGTCGGGCPSGRKTPYRVRQIVRKCLLGLKEEVITDDALWMCTTCYTCQERCPRSVKIVEIIKLARNVAAHAGYMADAHKKTGEFVIKTGHGVPINDATKALRKRVGLSELPPTTHSDPKALKEVQDICKFTGFDDLIGYKG